MPRKPKATSPKAKTAGASMVAPRPTVRKQNATAIRMPRLRPSQYPEKLPATKPDRMLSDAPPSSEDVTISFTWLELIKVKTLTSSGRMAPASVPQEIIAASFHQSVASPPSVGIIILDTMKVRTMDTIEVSQTREVSGASKFMSSELP